MLVEEHQVELLGWMDSAYVMQQGTIIQQYDNIKHRPWQNHPCLSIISKVKGFTRF